MKDALSAAEKTSTVFTELQKAGSSDGNRANLIQQLMKQLEALVDQTEVELGMIRVDRLRAALGEAVGRRGGGAQLTAPVRGSDSRNGAASDRGDVPAELASFLSGTRNRLKGYRVRMAELGGPLLESMRVAQNDDALQASLVSRVDAAKATLQRATLSHAGAELELKAFLELEFPQELAIAEQEISQAEADLKRAEDKRGEAGERLEKFRRHATGTASDLFFEYQFQAAGAVAELEWKRATFVLEQAGSKRKVLTDYTKSKRTKELRAALEKARSEELMAKAVSASEEGKHAKLRDGSKGGTLPDSKKKAMLALEEALATELAIRAKIEQLGQSGKIDAGLQKEIADSTNQLGGIVENAEGECALVALDKLKVEIERAAERKQRFRLPFRGRPKNED